MGKKVISVKSEDDLRDLFLLMTRDAPNQLISIDDNLVSLVLTASNESKYNWHLSMCQIVFEENRIPTIDSVVGGLQTRICEGFFEEWISVPDENFHIVNHFMGIERKCDIIHIGSRETMKTDNL